MKLLDKITPIIGKSYVFPDGDKIEVIQAKSRSEEDVLVTVHITQGPGIPRKLVFPIQEFLDNSLLTSASQLKILHGKGSGILRKVLWSKAKEYKDIKKIWHPKDDFGGAGVTFISF